MNMLFQGRNLVVALSLLAGRVAFGEHAEDVRQKNDTKQANAAEAERDSTPVKELKVQIPLHEIWVHSMPGEKQLAKLDEGRARGFLISPIFKTLARREKIETGLIVRGKGLDALKQLYRIRVAGDDPPVLTSMDEVSLVFFTYPTSWHVNLHRVTLTNNEIQICYRFVPHDQPYRQSHLALIPLGRLSAGEYQVQIEQREMDAKYIEMGYPADSTKFAAKSTCRPFRFQIMKKEGNP